MRQWSARCVGAIAFLLAGVPALPAGPRHVSMVPWKVIHRGEAPKAAPLSVFWIPASRDELRRSELLTSDELTSYAAHCVAMQVVRPDDDALIEKLDAEELPVAILVDEEGRELGRVAHERGALRAREVEELVREALDDRGAAADALLDEARDRAEAGEMEQATRLYEKVAAQRCLCPRQGKHAQRALRKLNAAEND
jgi:hypothetical protein